MKSNKIVCYQINKKYIAFYLFNGQKYIIKGSDLPYKFVKILMKKNNARYFEVLKWIRNNYIDNINYIFYKIIP